MATSSNPELDRLAEEICYLRRQSSTDELVIDTLRDELRQANSRCLSLREALLRVARTQEPAPCWCNDDVHSTPCISDDRCTFVRQLLLDEAELHHYRCLINLEADVGVLERYIQQLQQHIVKPLRETLEWFTDYHNYQVTPARGGLRLCPVLAEGPELATKALATTDAFASTLAPDGGITGQMAEICRIYPPHHTDLE